MKLTTIFFLFKVLGYEISFIECATIILSIIAIVIAIIFGIPVIMTRISEIKKEKLKQQSLFKDSNWIISSQLTYSSLDFIREMQEEQNPSSQEGIKETILEILNERRSTENQNHILLIGPSLSGKSHITVSVLKNLPDAYILRPDEVTFNDAAKEGFEFPDLPQNAQYKIVLLDNFHEFFKGSESSPIALIHKTIEKGFIIWANCISIEEYERVKNFLDFKTMESFKEIKLDKRLNKDEEDKIAINLGKEKPLSTSNGLIGEIIYPPKDIIQHYHDLKYDADSIPYDILLLIKQAYLLGAFSLPYSMKIELLQKAYSKDNPVNNAQIKNALKKIETKGFIKLLNDNSSFSFDSVWLNEIVEPEMKAKEFYHYWDKIISMNVVTYTHFMVDSKNYSEAVFYFEDMQSNKIIPDLCCYNILIKLSPKYETALEWFNKNIKEKADIYTYNCLIYKSPDYEIALEWYYKIEEGKANEITYNSLINKSPNYEIALEWFNKIEKGKATKITYNSLIKKSPDYNTALEWFNQIEEGKADVYTYSSLIIKSPNYKIALEWFNKIEEGKANDITYNSLIKKSPNYETALEWFNKIGEGKANVITYCSLIVKSPSYETALEWFNKVEGGKANVNTYCSLINKSPNYKTALKWFNKIEEGKADVYTYNCLIYKSPDYDTALEWFNKIEKEKKQIDDYTYGALIKLVSKSHKSNKYQLAISLHEEMLTKGIRSNVAIFTNLIGLSPDFEQGFKLLELMITKKDKTNKWIRPDKITRKEIEKKANDNIKLLNKVDKWFKENIPN